MFRKNDCFQIYLVERADRTNPLTSSHEQARVVRGTNCVINKIFPSRSCSYRKSWNSRKCDREDAFNTRFSHVLPCSGWNVHQQLSVFLVFLLSLIRNWPDFRSHQMSRSILYNVCWIIVSVVCGWVRYSINFRQCVLSSIFQGIRTFRMKLTTINKDVSRRQPTDFEFFSIP